MRKSKFVYLKKSFHIIDKYSSFKKPGGEFSEYLDSNKEYIKFVKSQKNIVKKKDEIKKADKIVKLNEYTENEAFLKKVGNIITFIDHNADLFTEIFNHHQIVATVVCFFNF